MLGHSFPTRRSSDLPGALQNKGGTDQAPETTGPATPSTMPPTDTPPPNAKPPANGVKVPQSNNAAPDAGNPQAAPPKPHIGSEKEAITDPIKDYQLARALDLLQGLALVHTGDASGSAN